MNVGTVQRGSMYSSERVSRRRGTVGLDGRVMLSSEKRDRSSVWAVGDERSGKLRLMEDSIVGMKGRVWKGELKSMSGGESEVSSVALRSWTITVICCNSLSVLEIRSSRCAPTS